MIRKFRMLAIFALIVAMLPISSICVSASGTTITVASVEAKPGETVEVPITLSNNTGICGATIAYAYDSELVLTGIERGPALPMLKETFTEDFSLNPVTIPMENIDAQDTSNGVIYILKFTAPDKEGIYDINIVEDSVDVFDRDINSVNVDLVNGQIKVESEKKPGIMAENIGVFTADDDYIGSSLFATAFKAELGDVTGTLSFVVTPENGEAKTFADSAHITDANIVLGIVVSGLADENATCEITVK